MSFINHFPSLQYIAFRKFDFDELWCSIFVTRSPMPTIEAGLMTPDIQGSIDPSSTMTDPIPFPDTVRTNLEVSPTAPGTHRVCINVTDG